MTRFSLIPYAKDGVEVCPPRPLYAETVNEARVAAREWLRKGPSEAVRASVYRGAELVASIDTSVSLA